MNKYLFEIPAKYWMYQALAYFVFIFVLFCFIPIAVVNHPWIVLYMDFMASWVPMLSEIKKIPGYQQSLAFYYSVFWTAIPLLALGLVAFGAGHPNVKAAKETRIGTPLLPIFRIFSFFGFCVLLSLLWPVNMGTNSWRDQTVVRGGFGFSFFGFMTMWGWSLWFISNYILLERLVLFIFKKIVQGAKND